MDSSKIDMFFAANGKKFLPVNAATLREKMERADDGKFPVVQSVELKDPTTMFLISFFVGEFGVDCFMMGKTGKGVLKLLTLGLCGILWLIDLFTIGNQAREKNFADVMAVL